MSNNSPEEMTLDELEAIPSEERSTEETKEYLKRLDEKNPSAEIVDSGGVKLTNDPETIREAERRGELDLPDEQVENSEETDSVE